MNTVERYAQVQGCPHASNYCEGMQQIMRDAGVYYKGIIRWLWGHSFSCQVSRAMTDALQNRQVCPGMMNREGTLAKLPDSIMRECVLAKLLITFLYFCCEALRGNLWYYEGCGFLLWGAPSNNGINSWQPCRGFLFFIMRDAGQTAPANNYRSRQYK